jgi:hypothetical protein
MYTHCLKVFVPGAELKVNRAASSIPSEATIVDDNDLEHISYSEWDTTVYVGAALLRLKSIALTTTFRFRTPGAASFITIIPCI